MNQMPNLPSKGGFADASAFFGIGVSGMWEMSPWRWWDTMYIPVDNSGNIAGNIVACFQSAQNSAYNTILSNTAVTKDQADTNLVQQSQSQYDFICTKLKTRLITNAMASGAGNGVTGLGDWFVLAAALAHQTSWSLLIDGDTKDKGLMIDAPCGGGASGFAAQSDTTSAAASQRWATGSVSNGVPAVENALSYAASPLYIPAGIPWELDFRFGQFCTAANMSLYKPVTATRVTVALQAVMEGFRIRRK